MVATTDVYENKGKIILVKMVQTSTRLREDLKERLDAILGRNGIAQDAINEGLEMWLDRKEGKSATAMQAVNTKALDERNYMPLPATVVESIHAAIEDLGRAKEALEAISVKTITRGTTIENSETADGGIEPVAGHAIAAEQRRVAAGILRSVEKPTGRPAESVRSTANVTGGPGETPDQLRDQSKAKAK